METTGNDPEEEGTGSTGRLRYWIALLVTLGASAAAILVALSVFGNEVERTTVRLERADASPSDSFTPRSDVAPPVPVRADTPGFEIPRGTDGTVAGTAPLLYADVIGDARCDRPRLTNLLVRDSIKAAAWAEVVGIEPVEITDFVSGLTPALLRQDAYLVNHYYVGALARPENAVLQAGTAVLVDDVGVPRVRCAAGSPLASPEQEAISIDPLVVDFVGQSWREFSLREAVTIVPGSSASSFEMIDVAAGAAFLRPTGSTGEGDLNLADASRGEVALADVVGFDIAEADRRLDVAGLTSTVRRLPSETAPVDTVLASDPPAGSVLVRGDVVTLTLSSGPPQRQAIVLPDMVGQPFRTTLDLLTGAGLETLAVTEESRSVASGKILRTEPSAGSSLFAGDSVTIVVSLLEEVQVPVLAGVSEAEAISRLRTFGLVPDITRRMVADVPKGNVINTNPGGGTRVDATTVVILAISDGPPPVREPLPDVTDIRIGDAAARLRALGMVPVLDESYSDDVPRGNVVRQVPGPGTFVVVDTEVTIYESIGPQPTTTTTEAVPTRTIMPDVSGLTPAEATKRLEAVRLTTKVVFQANPDVPEGVVAAHIPGPNTRALFGTEVTLVVSTGPGEVRAPTASAEQATAPRVTTTTAPTRAIVPQVAGRTPEEADATLEAARLTSKVLYQASSSVPAGSIIAHIPGAGTRVPFGSEVTYIVSAGPGTLKAPTATPEEAIATTTTTTAVPTRSVVPDVSGVTPEEATEQLAALRLGAKLLYQSSNSITKGRVVAHIPGPGTRALYGSEVTLVISTGPGELEAPTEEPPPGY